jgi:predicted RNase H-like HicB family nuclease
MTSVIYPAIARRDAAGEYVADFPDLPGVAAAGHSQADLLTRAREALRARLEQLAGDGETWPEPSAIETLGVEPPASVLLVDANLDDAPVRVNISIGERLLRQMDEAAERRGMSRSGFIAEAARAALARESARPGWKGAAELDAAASALQAELSAAARKLKDQFAPGSTFNRSMQELDDRISEMVRKTADGVSAAVSRRQESARAGATAGEPPVS